MVANLNDVVVIAVHTDKIRFRAPDKRGAAAIIGVGRSVILVVRWIRATLNFNELGIPETTHGESVTRVVVVPVDA